MYIILPAEKFPAACANNANPKWKTFKLFKNCNAYSALMENITAFI